MPLSTLSLGKNINPRGLT
ncbi:hypothetical protein BN1708_008519 [Verticillium longisporum]|uniref:Uncharacterized protein n=1 Tax=Verticillium longisporum TaxID=100787 RepID=A0A0G4N5F4_VERLO|nr:hypothetical protein BN1708_008519 [Verticillium longisporum]